MIPTLPDPIRLAAAQMFCSQMGWRWDLLLEAKQQFCITCATNIINLANSVAPAVAVSGVTDEQVEQMAIAYLDFPAGPKQDEPSIDYARRLVRTLTAAAQAGKSYPGDPAAKADALANPNYEGERVEPPIPSPPSFTQEEREAVEAIYAPLLGKPAPNTLGRADDGDTIKRVAAELALDLDALFNAYLNDINARSALERFLWENKVGLLRIAQATASPSPPAQSGEGQDNLVLELLWPVMLHSNPEQTNAERRRASIRIATLTQALAEARDDLATYGKDTEATENRIIDAEIAANLAEASLENECLRTRDLAIELAEAEKVIAYALRLFDTGGVITSPHGSDKTINAGSWINSARAFVERRKVEGEKG